MSRIIPYGRQHITEEDIQSVVNVLRSDFLTQGPKVAEFEEAFAGYIGSKYAVAVSSGTAALHLSASVLGVQSGVKVITSPITFAATANCIEYCGGDIVLADIDPDTYLLDIKHVEALLGKAPIGTYKGIIPVDLTGNPVNMEAYRKLADKYNVWLLEDACHAPGAYFIDLKGIPQKCGNGTFSDLAIFSFHPVKHIASGEGGMITTNNSDLYEKLLMLRTHGITKQPNRLNEDHGGWYYEMQMLGYNYRLTDFQAALALSQLKRADEGLNKRSDIANIYDRAFSDYSIVRQTRDDFKSNAYHLYIIEVENRKELYDHLRTKGIFAQVHYIPLYYMPYYQHKGWKKKDYPHAEGYYSKCLSLPMYPSLTESDQQYVIESVLEFVGK